jgi:hypothetical protein
MEVPACPLLAAAGATLRDGVWRVRVSALDAACAADASLGKRRRTLSRFDVRSGRVTVAWASEASIAAWGKGMDARVLGQHLSNVAAKNAAIGSIFAAAAEAAARGDCFAHVVAEQGAPALQRMRFTPVDVVEGASPAPSPVRAAAASPLARAPDAGKRSRHVLDELLLPEEASAPHDQLVQRACALTPRSPLKRMCSMCMHVRPERPTRARARLRLACRTPRAACPTDAPGPRARKPRGARASWRM